MIDKITFNRDRKFDLQLGRAQAHEERLAKLLTGAKIELKTETWQWEQTGNIAIEFSCDGKPSGIGVTEADWWIHELCRGDQTLVYLMFPVGRLKDLCREAYRQGRHRRGGDDNRFEMVLIRVSDLLK
jgi:hypothetical protein